MHPLVLKIEENTRGYARLELNRVPENSKYGGASTDLDRLQNSETARRCAFARTDDEHTELSNACINIFLPSSDCVKRSCVGFLTNIYRDICGALEHDSERGS